MKKIYIWGAIVAVATGVFVSGVFTNKESSSVVKGSEDEEVYACNMDAKICPDGSSVGRTGPLCEFAACPSLDATEATLTTYLGGEATEMNFTVNPREVVADSRCPQGVQCIWAGTVEVRTAVSTKVGHGEHVFKIGEPRVVGDFSVTLVEVTPGAKVGEKIPDSSYRFTFKVEKIK